MIHASIDDPDLKNILGYEVGTRKEFDEKYGGDPYWVFLDFNIIKYRVKTSDFLLNPKNFYLDSQGNPQKRDVIIPQ